MKKKMFSLLVVFCLLASVTSNVFAMEREVPNESPATKMELLEAVNELEYIFTNIVVKDETTGKYIVDEVELNNSSYSEEVKAGMIIFAEYLNEDSDTVTATNTFKRCISEAFGIYGGALDQLVGYIDRADWVGALAVLSFFGVSTNPVILFIFAMNCGAGSASSLIES